MLAVQRTGPEARWNDNIGDYLKGGDGVVLPDRYLCTPANCVSGAPSDAVYQIESEFGPLLGFDTASATADTGDIEDICLINFQVKHKYVSHVITSVSLPMLDEQMMLASNIVIRCRFQDISAVMNVFY
jgi:hypothetical protein